MSFQENYIHLCAKEIAYSCVRSGVCYQRLKTSKRIIKHNNLKFQRGVETASGKDPGEIWLCYEFIKCLTHLLCL